MSKLSFIDKLKIFFEVSKSTSWILIVVIALLVVGFIFLKNNKKNEDITKKVYGAFALIVMALVVINYHSPLNNLFDYMMNNLFIAIYFPNLAIYFAAILITNVVLWISLFNYKTSDNIKKLNIVVYLLMNYLLVLILSVINKNQLDIFNQSSVYNNTKATALIELSSIIFIVWVIFLILYKLILTYIRKDYKQKVKKVVVKKEIKKLPDNFNRVEIPDVIYGNISHKVKESVKEDELKKVYEDMLTLDDYKQILDILKKKKRKTKVIDQKEKVNDQKLEKLKIELLKQQEIEREQSKFTELDNLYRSIK